jgi:threonine/homoserine/homoserine lactone efflux protein
MGLIGLGQYIAFVGVSLLVICTPGQDTALTIRNTLLGNSGTGAATALGVSAGQATWTVATSAGLAVILMASAPLFLAIKLAGAAYLVYLGARALVKAIAHRDSGEAATLPASRLSARTAFVQGFLSNLSNAKMLVLGLNFSLLTLAWLVGYAFAVERMGRWLRHSGVRRAIDGVLGAVLLALGLRVGSEALASSLMCSERVP